MRSICFGFTILAFVYFVSINKSVNGVCSSNQIEIQEPIVGVSSSFVPYGSSVITFFYNKKNQEKYNLIALEEYVIEEKIYRCVNFLDYFNDKASFVEGSAVLGFEHGNCEGSQIIIQIIFNLIYLYF